MALHSEFPTNVFDIRTDGHGFQKVNRELLCIFRGQTFENAILKMRKPLRQTEFVFVG
jgi:hypothetical protein